MQKIIVIAAAAVLFSGSVAGANTGFACSFLGGQPGAADSEGNTGPFSPNGVEYKGEGQSIRDASASARQSCTAGEALGTQGCLLNGCTDMASAAQVVPSALPPKK